MSAPGVGWRRAAIPGVPGVPGVLGVAVMLGLLAWNGRAAGQEAEREASPYESALSASSVATAMVQAGRLDDAFEMLEDVLLRCSADPDRAAGCRRVTLYSLGYVHQLGAEVRPEEREDLLRRASAYFRDVLSQDPGYDAARRGLVQAYRKIGAREWQEEDLRALAAQDPGGRYHIVLGDYLREHGRPEEAADAYRQAMERAPRDEEPRHRLLSLHRSSELPVEELEPLLAEWEVRFPDLAARGYQLVMRRRYPRDPVRAADALARWLVAKDHLDQVGPALSEEIPEDWSAPPFSSLRAFLLAPLEAELAGWWMETPERRDVVGSAALALGRWRLAEGDPSTAERVWERGRDLAQENWPSWVDLTAELALLYDQVPGLDPDSSKFDRLENELFAGKGAAIGRQDHEATLRFHRTLGLIYARRGVWGPTRGARNAIFQLEHALLAAAAARDETGVHRPLPGVRARLGEALLASGDTVGARRAFLDAAVAHVEVDDPEGAAELLELARGPGTTDEIRSDAEAVERLVTLAGRVAEAVGAEGAEGAGRCGPELLEIARGLRPERALDGDAVVRQRFRTLVDCSSGAGRDGPVLAAEALEEILVGGTPLVGVADLSRVEDARRLVFGGFGQSVGRLPAPTSAPDRPRGVVPLAIGGDERGVFIDAGSDALTAARIVRALGPPGGSLRLRVQDGEVTVLEAGLEAERVLEVLRRMEGVDRLRVRSSGM